MENAQKAVIMGASVFMFVVSLSIAIYLYSSISYNVDSILTTSENFNRTAEYFLKDDINIVRSISKAEVIMSIIDLYNSTGYKYEKIIVNGIVFEKDIDYSSSNELANILGKGTNNYVVVNENFVEKTISYIESVE